MSVPHAAMARDAAQGQPRDALGYTDAGRPYLPIHWTAVARHRTEDTSDVELRHPWQSQKHSAIGAGLVLVSDADHTLGYLDNSFGDEKLCAQRLKKIHAQ
jgi:hypothetical protein